MFFTLNGSKGRIFLRPLPGFYLVRIRNFNFCVAVFADGFWHKDDFKNKTNVAVIL